MYYLVDFARKKGAKDRKKRKVKRGWAFQLGQAVGAGSLIGMGAEGFRGRKIFKHPDASNSQKFDVFTDRLTRGQLKGVAGGLLVGGGILGAKHLRNKLKNKKK
jgi:hypothetical protein